MPETTPTTTERQPDRPTWSVMIPVHNCAPYLAHALPEVIAQLGRRIDAEIVVVDDNSNDNPKAVVDRLGGGRVRYAPNPAHLGAIATFNRCLALAGGELVHLLHGDDAVLPGFYPTMECAFDDRSAVAAVCRTRDTDADDRPHYLSRSYRRGTGVWPDALGVIAVSNRVRAAGVVVRRRAYAEVGGYRTDLPHAADWEMWTRLAAHGPIVFVDEILADYRKHDASDTSARVRTGANVRERVTAIGVVAAHLPTARRTRLTRRALGYSVVFAARSALTQARRGDWPTAFRQGREALRCARLWPHGVPAVSAFAPPARPVEP